MSFQGLRQLSWLIALSIAPGILFAGELTGIRLSSGPLATRIVLDLNGAGSYSVFELENPARLVIDLPDMRASSSLRLPVPKGRVRSVRTGARPDGELRVVLDLSERAAASTFTLPPDGSSGHRLVIDLASSGRSAGASSAATIPTSGSAPARAPVSPASTAAAAPAPSAAVPPNRVVREEYTGRDLVIVIDAGHGGKDPGTAGRSGVREKDVVLDIARRFADLVQQQPGMRPVLVRGDDRFVTLSDRLRIAHDAQADFFISIHADWNESASVGGATVYSIETGRAASEQARILAARENGADLIGGASISAQNDLLAYVLLDVMQKASRRNSIVAGSRVIDRLSSVTPMRKSTVQQGNFVVLTSPDIPSLLVEAAFLSNKRDEANLRDPAYRHLLARALFDGMLDYYRTNAPPDTWLARNPPPEQRAPIRHVIARGETLSEIAERYRISLRELRQTNSIQGDVIRIGQVLTIPTRG